MNNAKSEEVSFSPFWKGYLGLYGRVVKARRNNNTAQRFEGQNAKYTFARCQGPRRTF